MLGKNFCVLPVDYSKIYGTYDKGIHACLNMFSIVLSVVIDEIVAVAIVAFEDKLKLIVFL